MTVAIQLMEEPGPEVRQAISDPLKCLDDHHSGHAHQFQSFVLTLLAPTSGEIIRGLTAGIMRNRRVDKGMLTAPKLIPELDVEDLDRSLAFYVGTVGFRVLFSRPEDRFAYLDLAGVHLMLEELGGSGRYFTNTPLAHPYGRGVNFQIEVADVDALYGRVLGSGFPVPISLEARWCRRDTIEKGNRQFVVADPDGYLLRFFTSLGQRPMPS